MSVFDYSDAMILAGSFFQGKQDGNDVNFLAALVMGLGINIQFEETRLSITRILATSIVGYYIGKYVNQAQKTK